MGKVRNGDAEVREAFVVEKSIEISALIEAYARCSQIIETPEEPYLAVSNPIEKGAVILFIIKSNNPLAGKAEE